MSVRFHVRMFILLLLSSALAGAFLFGRFVMYHAIEYRFMLWNLMLAWMPYLLSLLILVFRPLLARTPLHLLLPGFVWLIFLPNAPYMVTDFIHLRYRNEFVWWYDLGMLAAFAWAGCFLAVASIQMMQDLIASWYGRVVGWLFAFATIGLSGLGVYLGRFQRWNTWDLFVAPHQIAADVTDTLLDPSGRRQMIGVTLMFAALLLVVYLMFTSARPTLQPVRR